MNGQLATQADNAFLDYAAQVGSTGNYLYMKNGEFLYGQDAKEAKLGTRLAANVAGLRIGWKCWKNGMVAEDRLFPLASGQKAEPRNSLGDLDEELWEKNDEGQPRDPWQFTNQFELADSVGNQYIYATSSKGGIGAVGRLCKAYGTEYRQHPGQVPIIELQRDSYIHAKYGKTYFPVFNIVDWVDENVLSIADNGDEDSAPQPWQFPIESVTPPAPAPKPAASNGKAKPRF